MITGGRPILGNPQIVGLSQRSIAVDNDQSGSRSCFEEIMVEPTTNLNKHRGWIRLNGGFLPTSRNNLRDRIDWPKNGGFNQQEINKYTDWIKKCIRLKLGVMNFNGLMKFDFKGFQYQKSGRVDYFAKVLRIQPLPSEAFGYSELWSCVMMPCKLVPQFFIN